MTRIVTRVLPVLLALSLVGFPTVSAEAQPNAKKDPKTEALELFEKSADLYRQGKFDEAAQLLERAYSLHDEAVLLYNLGRAYEGLGENQKAIDAYTKYLEKAPKAKDRGALERRMETLKAQLAQQNKPLPDKQPEPVVPAKPVAPEPDRPPPSRGPGVLPWVVAGVGVAAVGAGLFVGLQAKSKRDDAQDNPESRAAQEDYDSAKSMATTANVLLIAGTVVAAGGVTWALLSRKKSEPAAAAPLHFTVTPGGFRIGGRL
ncbi:MAG: tetratricopeptide repeat protein [Myxococcales bacterium]|nr:tetratricopeptide repeat protein [Myxococcales bacterium]